MRDDEGDETDSRPSNDPPRTEDSPSTETDPDDNSRDSRGRTPGGSEERDHDDDRKREHTDDDPEPKSHDDDPESKSHDDGGVRSGDRHPPEESDSGTGDRGPPGTGQSRTPPPDRTADTNDVPAPSEDPIGWYLNSRHGLVVASRDVFVSVAMVVLIALVLYGVSGVWPPLVAVESGSMEPNMKQGDLVLIVDNERYAHPDAHGETGIITTETGEEVGHESFGKPGNVIVFQDNGRDGTPIIHRARHHVDAEENWYERANREHLRGYSSCVEMPRGACPAPHDGFVTKGDANGAYDQVERQSVVVREEWIQGKAVARIPWLGCVRLELTSDRTCLNGRT